MDENEKANLLWKHLNGLYRAFVIPASKKVAYFFAIDLFLSEILEIIDEELKNFLLKTITIKADIDTFRIYFLFEDVIHIEDIKLFHSILKGKAPLQIGDLYLEKSVSLPFFGQEDLPIDFKSYRTFEPYLKKKINKPQDFFLKLDEIKAGSKLFFQLPSSKFQYQFPSIETMIISDFNLLARKGKLENGDKELLWHFDENFEKCALTLYEKKRLKIHKTVSIFDDLLRVLPENLASFLLEIRKRSFDENFKLKKEKKIPLKIRERFFHFLYLEKEKYFEGGSEEFILSFLIAHSRQLNLLILYEDLESAYFYYECLKKFCGSPLKSGIDHLGTEKLEGTGIFLFQDSFEELKIFSDFILIDKAFLEFNMRRNIILFSKNLKEVSIPKNWYLAYLPKLKPIRMKKISIFSAFANRVLKERRFSEIRGSSLLDKVPSRLRELVETVAWFHGKEKIELDDLYIIQQLRPAFFLSNFFSKFSDSEKRTLKVLRKFGKIEKKFSDLEGIKSLLEKGILKIENESLVWNSFPLEPEFYVEDLFSIEPGFLYQIEDGRVPEFIEKYIDELKKLEELSDELDNL